MAEKPSKNAKKAQKCDFLRFFGHNSDIFKYFAKRIFDLSSVIIKALLLMYNTTIFEKIHFLTFFRND